MTFPNWMETSKCMFQSGPTTFIIMIHIQPHSSTMTYFQKDTISWIILINIDWPLQYKPSTCITHIQPWLTLISTLITVTIINHQHLVVPHSTTMNLKPSPIPHHEDVRQALQVRHALRTLGFNVTAIPGRSKAFTGSVSLWLRSLQKICFMMILWWFYGDVLVILWSYGDFMVIVFHFIICSGWQCI